MGPELSARPSRPAQRLGPRTAGDSTGCGGRPPLPPPGACSTSFVNRLKMSPGCSPSLTETRSRREGRGVTSGKRLGRQAQRRSFRPHPPNLYGATSGSDARTRATPPNFRLQPGPARALGSQPRGSARALARGEGEMEGSASTPPAAAASTSATPAAVEQLDKEQVRGHREGVRKRGGRGPVIRVVAGAGFVPPWILPEL